MSVELLPKRTRTRWTHRSCLVVMLGKPSRPLLLPVSDGARPLPAARAAVEGEGEGVGMRGCMLSRLPMAVVGE